jgi:integrase
VRSVPIHASLQPLVARLMKQTSDGYLIPGLLTGGADAKRGHLLGKRFGNHIRREGFDDPALCFHTLRNAFINRIRSAGVQPHTIKQIVGHSEEDLTNQYAGIETPAELAKAMQKVSFGPLDAYLREAAGKVKVDANMSHRRPDRKKPKGAA